MKIPSDVRPSGCGQRGPIHIILYGKTEEELTTKIDKYFQEYNPRGYSTRIVGRDRITKHVDGYYLSHIERFASCD